MTNHDKQAQNEWLSEEENKPRLTWKEILLTIIGAAILYVVIGYTGAK